MFPTTITRVVSFFLFLFFNTRELLTVNLHFSQHRVIFNIAQRNIKITT